MKDSRQQTYFFDLSSLLLVLIAAIMIKVNKRVSLGHYSLSHYVTIPV